MNIHLANLSAPKLRDLLIEESKKFNLAIKYGSPVSDLQDILAEIKQIEILLAQKEAGEIPQSRAESPPPHRTTRRNSV